MSWRWLVIAAGLIFLVSLTLQFPLSAAIRLASARPLNNAYIAGTIWRGSITNVELAGYSHAVNIASNNGLALLGLGWSGHFAAAGPLMDGRGALSTDISGATTLRKTKLNIRFPAAQTPGNIELAMAVRIDELTVGADGRCKAAEGFAQSDSLARAGTALGWQAPVLTGKLGCEDGRIALNLSGEAKSGEAVTLYLAHMNRGGFVSVMDVKTTSPQVIAALSTAGFSLNGDRYSRRDEGYWYDD